MSRFRVHYVDGSVDEIEAKSAAAARDAGEEQFG
jgi:hypothetical protein